MVAVKGFDRWIGAAAEIAAEYQWSLNYYEQLHCDTIIFEFVSRERSKPLPGMTVPATTQTNVAIEVSALKASWPGHEKELLLAQMEREIGLRGVTYSAVITDHAIDLSAEQWEVLRELRAMAQPVETLDAQG